MSNYPAGVSGTEFAISGPTFEDSAHMYCGYCDTEQNGTIQGHPDRGIWFICGECEQTTDLAD